MQQIENSGDTAMDRWSGDVLRKVVEADDLHIAPFRENGKTYGTLTWIWSVAVDGALYVRAYNGQESSWYQAAMGQKAGRITAAGMKESEGPAMDELMREVPIARLGRPEEIASAVLWLCSPGAAYVIGHALVVDGGYTIH
jgi:Uncharacterized protein conserved in bacteria (DUF2255)/Enoyl-(Acyl carrier protein) reductase